MIKVESSGSFAKMEAFLRRMKDHRALSSLEAYGQLGVDALSSATPLDSGETAHSWTYHVTYKRGKYSITWNNTHVVDGVQIAVVIQYGHATKNGSWVEGQEYINEALRPVFDKIAKDIWNEVTRNG